MSTLAVILEVSTLPNDVVCFRGVCGVFVLNLVRMPALDILLKGAKMPAMIYR